MNNLIQFCLDNARNSWELGLIAWPDESVQDAERAACSLAVTAAEIAAYLGERGANGYGDNGHADGIRAAQKAAKRVRKALGYTIP